MEKIKHNFKDKPTAGTEYTNPLLKIKSRKILDKYSFNIDFKNSSTVILFGANGNGKTVLLNHIDATVMESIFIKPGKLLKYQKNELSSFHYFKKYLKILGVDSDRYANNACLSKGVSVLGSVLHQICTKTNNDSIVLLDDIESNLDISVQRDMIKMLDVINKDMGIRFIVSTHSPALIHCHRHLMLHVDLFKGDSNV